MTTPVTKLSTAITNSNSHLCSKKTPSYRGVVRHPHYKPKMVCWLYQVYNGDPYTNKKIPGSLFTKCRKIACVSEQLMLFCSYVKLTQNKVYLILSYLILSYLTLSYLISGKTAYCQISWNLGDVGLNLSDYFEIGQVPQQTPVKFQSNAFILITNLAALRLFVLQIL